MVYYPHIIMTTDNRGVKNVRKLLRKHLLASHTHTHPNLLHIHIHANNHPPKQPTRAHTHTNTCRPINLDGHNGIKCEMRKGNVE